MYLQKFHLCVTAASPVLLKSIRVLVLCISRIFRINRIYLIIMMILNAAEYGSLHVTL